MGMSADAYLFYGYVWNDEHEELTDDDYAASEKGKEDHGVEIGWHGHIEYSAPFIYVTESEIHAWQMGPESVDPNAIRDDNLTGWNRALDAFIAENNINMSKPEYGGAPQGPGWFLVSGYG